MTTMPTAAWQYTRIYQSSDLDPAQKKLELDRQLQALDDSEGVADAIGDSSQNGMGTGLVISQQDRLEKDISNLKIQVDGMAQQLDEVLRILRDTNGET